MLIALVAVLGFWLLGAYNRLVRQRNTLRTALSPLAAQLRQRHAVALTLTETSRTRLIEAGHDALLQAAQQAARDAGAASDHVTLRPLRGDVLSQVAAAEVALVAALDALALALQDLTSGFGPDAAVSDLLRQRDALREQIAFSRQVYNQAAEDYNRAVRLFPTTLAAAVFGFHTAPEFPPT
jgi:LemA protein